MAMANRENLSKLISQILYANWSAIIILINNFSTRIQQFILDLVCNWGTSTSWFVLAVRFCSTYLSGTAGRRTSSQRYQFLMSNIIINVITCHSFG